MPPYYIPATDAVSYTTDVADVGFASRCRYLVDRPLMLLPLVATPGAAAAPGRLVVVATLERWRPLVVVFAFRAYGVMSIAVGPEADQYRRGSRGEHR